MGKRRIVSGLAIVSGLVVGAVGAWAVGLYLWGVVDVLDQPDRSWIFWGAIFLLAGVPMVTAGGSLIAWGLLHRRPEARRDG